MSDTKEAIERVVAALRDASCERPPLIMEMEAPVYLIDGKFDLVVLASLLSGAPND